MEFKKKIVFILSMFVFISFSANGQKNYDTAKSISGKGKKCYEKAINHYRSDETEKAMEYFNKSLESYPDLIDAHLRIGAIYYDRKQYTDAEISLEKAISLDPEYDRRIYFSLANVQRENKKYKAAADNYEKFIERTQKQSDARERADKYLKQCNFASVAIDNPVPFQPIILSNSINKESSEYLPSFSTDGNSMIFTVRQNGQEDLYESKLKDEKWEERKPIIELNTTENEGAHTLSGDGKLVVFAKKTRHYNFDLFYAELINNRWTPVKNLGASINTERWESQPCLSADGKTLYFSSNRPGGQGGSDLWKSHRKKDGSWTSPKNLGATINTKGHEESPFIHHDNQTLYFRSNHHPGMGSFDIFFTKKGKEGWNSITNIGYPINTTGSEGAMIVSLDGETAYFASDMAGNKNLDIYKFDLYKEARPEKVSYLKVQIFDFETKKALKQVQVLVENLSNAERVVETELGNENNFISPVIVGKNYAINISKEGYLFHSENFRTDTFTGKIAPLIVDIYLKSIPKIIISETEPVILKNVFFETGSAELLPESEFDLQKLKSLLTVNSRLRIKINGHTDNVGNVDDNQKLSQERAMAVYDYLIKEGISESRLLYEGYGESLPIDSNESEEGRQRNRRTEFVIIPD
jgi:outer membrane protein OmpA-like peptidoglycan-associated protein/predicted negative regulator of RcsB-dependent stress response